MREVTYSQSLTIEDAGLLSTLAVFCEQVWLPDCSPAESVADAFAAVIEAEGPWPRGEETVRAIRTYHSIHRWEQQYRELFDADVLKRLPRSSSLDREVARRDEFSDKTMMEIFGAELPLYERIALRYHLLRADLPGIEFFSSAKGQPAIDLASALFYLELPRLSGDPRRLLDVRDVAQKADIRQFWQMIDEQAAYGQADGKAALVRAEKIRTDFKKWKDDYFKFRGAMLGTGVLVTLCWHSSAWAPLATFAAAQFLGEVNKWWVARHEKEHKAFKFINTIDAKLRSH